MNGIGRKVNFQGLEFFFLLLLLFFFFLLKNYKNRIKIVFEDKIDRDRRRSLEGVRWVGRGGAATIYTNETKIFDIRFFIVFTYQRF